MRITDILWKERFVAKLADKQGASAAEAEEALRSKPLVRKISKGRVRGAGQSGVEPPGRSPARSTPEGLTHPMGLQPQHMREPLGVRRLDAAFSSGEVAETGVLPDSGPHPREMWAKIRAKPWGEMPDPSFSPEGAYWQGSWNEQEG